MSLMLSFLSSVSLGSCVLLSFHSFTRRWRFLLDCIFYCTRLPSFPSSTLTTHPAHHTIHAPPRPFCSYRRVCRALRPFAPASSRCTRRSPRPSLQSLPPLLPFLRLRLRLRSLVSYSSPPSLLDLLFSSSSSPPSSPQCLPSMPFASLLFFHSALATPARLRFGLTARRRVLLGLALRHAFRYRLALRRQYVGPGLRTRPTSLVLLLSPLLFSFYFPSSPSPSSSLSCRPSFVTSAYAPLPTADGSSA